METRRINTVFLIAVLIVFVIVAIIVARDLVTMVVQVTLGVSAAVIVLSLVASAIYLVVYLIEKVRMLFIARQQAENQANLTVVHGEPGQMVWVHERKRSGTWRNLSMDPRIFIEVNDDGRRAPSIQELGAWQAFHQLYAPKAAIAAGNHPALPAPGDQPVDVLQVIQNFPVAIVVGTMDSGKTTLLQWIIDYYQRRAKILVLDPHSSPDRWPGAKVVGTGRNFGEIEQTLDGLVQLMNERYGEIGRGEVQEGDHPPIVVVADEWMAINEQCANADKMMVQLLTESRKAALKFYVGSHSRRVKSLGVDRKGDLLDGVAFILLRKVGSEHRAVIETYDGEETHRTEAILPGEYRVLQPDEEMQAEEELSQALTAEPSEEELQILIMHADGQSNRQISQAVYGQHGQHYNQKIEATLKKWEGWEPPSFNESPEDHSHGDPRSFRRNFRIIG